MKVAMKLKLDGKFVEDFDVVMGLSGLNPRMGFEDIGIQADGTPVIFDKCGNFAHIPDIYDLVVLLEGVF